MCLYENTLVFVGKRCGAALVRADKIIEHADRAETLTINCDAESTITGDQITKTRAGAALGCSTRRAEIGIGKCVVEADCAGAKNNTVKDIAPIIRNGNCAADIRADVIAGNCAVPRVRVVEFSARERVVAVIGNDVAPVLCDRPDERLGYRRRGDS